MRWRIWYQRISCPINYSSNSLNIRFVLFNTREPIILLLQGGNPDVCSFQNVLITYKQENICSLIILVYSNHCRAHLCAYIETKVQATVCCHGNSSVIHQQTWGPVTLYLPSADTVHPGCVTDLCFSVNHTVTILKALKMVSPSINQVYSSTRWGAS